jgi:hypothetical protein
MEGERRLAAGISTRLSEAELKRFGVTVAIPLALLAALGMWRGHNILPALLGGLATVLAGFAVVAPGRLRPTHRLWMGTAQGLGRFNTQILLAIVYFLIMTPTGVIMRLLGRDPLQRQLRDGTSYWVKRLPQPDPKGSMERQF